jgi:hypothetical protein
LLENEANELSLMKQGYDKGSVMFIRKLPGLFESTNLDGAFHFEQDKGATNDHIYIATRYKVTSSLVSQHSNHIHKIDVKDAVPR